MNGQWNEAKEKPMMKFLNSRTTTTIDTKCLNHTKMSKKSAERPHKGKQIVYPGRILRLETSNK